MKNKRKNKHRKLVFILSFLAGFLVLMYPTFADVWNRMRNAMLESDYQNSIEKTDTSEIDQIRADAQAYNAQHTVNTFEDAFDQSDQYILTHPYDTLLNPNGDEVMGSIEIPKINVDLAIYHGTGQDVLEKGVGHVQGTSLPVGGESTHAVLAAHRGLAYAKLFTDLDQLETGDKFFLHILDETLAYEVDQIRVVEPDDLSCVQIEEGKDLVTLLTCTPYGVNTQRLLVRGRRIPYVSADVETEKAKHEVHLQRDEPVRYLASGIMAVMIAVAVIRSIAEHHRK